MEKIAVPFAVESLLSGVSEDLGRPNAELWYEGTPFDVKFKLLDKESEFYVSFLGCNWEAEVG